MSPEAHAALNHLFTVCVGYRVSVNRKVARELLTHGDGTQLRAGRLMKIRTKSLGAGVYHVWLGSWRKETSDE